MAERQKLITDLKIGVKNPDWFVYEMRFNNFNNRITVKSVHRIGKIKDYHVTLKSTGKAGVFNISWDDFVNLRLTNSDTFSQHIYITYNVDGKTYVGKYREEDEGDLKFVAFV